MKKFLLPLVLFTACSAPETIPVDKEKIKQEVLATEKEFEALVAKSGVAEGFYQFADSNAIIKRRDDSLIIGKEDIRTYYAAKHLDSVQVTWTADYVDVSGDGELAWTYGQYKWIVPADSGKTETYTGIFHTVWKKQSDGTWKYVWD